MKIAITGITSTGKTTLAKLIGQKLTYPVVTNNTRDAIRQYEERNDENLRKIAGIRAKHGERVWQNLPLDLKMKLQIDMIDVVMRKEASYDNFVGDGSTIDKISWMSVYATALGMPDEVIEPVIAAAEASILKYDYVFYLPPGIIPIEDDGRRVISKLARRTVESVLKGYMALYATMGVKIYVLDERSIEDRINAIMTIVQNPDQPDRQIVAQVPEGLQTNDEPLNPEGKITANE